MQACETSFFSENLKLSLLWFDALVMQSPREDLVGLAIPRILEKLGARDNVLAEICQLVHPIQKYFPDYEFASPEVWTNDFHISSATQSALTKYFTEKDGPWPEEWMLRREVALTGCGVIDAINLVSRLSASGTCFLLPTDFEHEVLLEITRPTDPRTSFDLFQEVARYRFPRLTDMSWEKVAELRHHRFLESFRGVLASLQAELRKAPPNASHEIFVEIERKHIKELLSLLKPSAIQSTVKGIVTNIPLPIPLNPAALVDSVRTVLREREIERRFGWIYFLYELEG